jgi:hypothetical protein
MVRGSLTPGTHRRRLTTGGGGAEVFSSGARSEEMSRCSYS